MVILNKKLPIPTSPPIDWNVKNRKHVARDWRAPIIDSVITAVIVALMVLVTIHRDSILTTASKDTREGLYALGIGVTVVCLFISLFFWAVAVELPSREAKVARHKAFKAWKNDDLIPFLEERYGITFPPDASIFGWGPTFVSYKGRYIKIRINGMRLEYTSDDPASAYVVINPEYFSVDEIVEPAKVSYRPLDAL